MPDDADTVFQAALQYPRQTMSIMPKPPITIDHSSPVAPFEQVRSQLAAQATSGVLAVGTRLPTVRSLAEQLDLAANTVARAYRELETAGVVETRGRAGTFVAAAGNPVRERIHAEALRFAATVRDLGFDADEALEVVRVCLSQAGPGPSPPTRRRSATDSAAGRH